MVYDVRVPAKRQVESVPLLDRKDQERLIQAIYLDFSSKSAGILLTGWLIDGPNIPGRPFWVMRHRTPLLT